MKILVVDDEQHISELIAFNMELLGYEVETAFDGNEAKEKIMNEKYDLIILDVMLPVINGLTLLKDLRFESINKFTPVIMLTAKSENTDIILGLEVGADDYLPKPFDITVLKARAQAILRRNTRFNSAKAREEELIEIDNIFIDKNKRLVKINSKLVDFTKKEFDLLVYLIECDGDVKKRDEILANIWGYDYLGETRTVDVHIKNIRLKIEKNPKEPNYIKTQVGYGYYFDKGDRSE